MWLNVNLGKVNLEACWPVVYLVGRPTCPQDLVTHVLTGPALLHSPIVADQSQASWPLSSPPPSPLVSMFLASLHWFSSVMGAMVLYCILTWSLHQEFIQKHWRGYSANLTACTSPESKTLSTSADKVVQLSASCLYREKNNRFYYKPWITLLQNYSLL